MSEKATGDAFNRYIYREFDLLNEFGGLVVVVHSPMRTNIAQREFSEPLPYQLD